MLTANTTNVIIVFSHNFFLVMARDELDLLALLAYQLKPTLILDSSGTVVAVNEGSVRLILPHQKAISGNDGLLLGKSIADIGFALVPGGLPCRCTWKSVLDAAFDARRPTRGILPNSNDCIKSNSVPDIYSKSTEFWDQEDEYQSVIESNVHVTRKTMVNSAVDTILSVEESNLISARATVRWYPSSKDGVFLITLSRTSLSQPSVSCPLFEAPEAKHTPRENVDRKLNPCCQVALQHVEANSSDSNADLEGPVRFASGIASSIVPYILVVTDTDGQATSFSDSWYEFSGLTELRSLGDGWLTVLHEEDAIEMTTAWSEVHRNKPSHWKHQARFRMASDGTYCWFSIRAQPCEDATGNVLRWYASMIDINQWVVARLQADRRQHSILTLFSQTDVMLWEIDKANRVYICEGRLNWDPTRVVELLTHNLQEQNAHTDDTEGNEKHRGDDHLVRTIRTVLRGCAFSPVVEHWEGDRYFRTRFVAERCSPSDGGDDKRHDVVEAAVALTFDITEEKVRSTLQMENKRLIASEQAALDATNLKSRFLANVRALP
jgi:PAS domain S-box-containing protein